MVEKCGFERADEYEKYYNGETSLHYIYVLKDMLC